MRIFKVSCVCGLRCQLVGLLSVSKVTPLQNLVYSYLMLPNSNETNNAMLSTIDAS